ncbi:MAG: hypothetical protein LKK00_05060 [Intestinimonas sp.]|jgi:hypothetical protein|nr:hypothetical protein [Intestinimonas sp.]
MAKRPYGAEQPYIPAGIFKIRLPGIHYKWSFPEMGQALLMCATCLGAIPVLTEVLGVSYELALSMVIINGFGYTLHVLLGDPVVPGWITPAVPLVIAFLTNYQIGPDRTQTMIALQFEVGLIFLFFGITGLGSKIVHIVPNSVKAGILLGGGIAAVLGEMKAGGRFATYPISVAVGTAIAFFCLFSPQFSFVRSHSKFWNAIGKYGMLPAILVAVILGPIVGELPWPQIEIGSVIMIPDFAGLFRTLSPFGIGWPSMTKWITSIPTAIVVYIIAFGDFVTSESLIGEADEVRQDEKIDFNANRSNIISGIRNIGQSLICPYTQLCGPLWAAVTAAVAQRYKEGPEAMDSLYSGLGTFRISTWIAVATIPISSLLTPVLPVALSLTLLVQGYICTRLAMSMCKTDLDRGISGVMGAVLATRGAAWGLAVGLLLHFLLYFYSAKKAAALEAKTAE